MFRIPRWFYAFVPFKFAAGCSSPLIPLLIISLGGTATEISIVSTAYSMVSMGFLVIWGRLSDSTQKRKPFLVVGFAGFSLVLLLFSQAESITHALYLQVASAVFAAATVPVSSVYLLRSARKEFWDQAIGEFSRIGGYAWAFGLLFGTLVLKILGVGNLFVLLGIICFLSSVLFQKMVKEKPIYINRDQIVSFANIMTEKLRLMPSYVIHFPLFMSVENKRLRNFYLASFVLFVSSGLIFTPFVYFLTMKGASATFVFFISFLNSLISAYSYSRVAKRVALFGGFSILGRGLFLRALFFLVLILASMLTGYKAVGLAAVCYCVFGYTWAQIAVSSNSVMSRLAIKGKEGKIMGMYNFMASLGLIMGNFISGVVVDSLGFTVEFLLGLAVIVSSLAWMQGIKMKEDSEMKLQVKEAFEKNIAERKKWWNLLTFQKIDEYLDIIGVERGDRVLDVASGDGIVASRLSKRGCKVVAIDISPAFFSQRIRNVEYEALDAEEMDYKEEFDLITCRNAFHYFPNPQVVLQKMRDALKVDGWLLLMEPVATTESYSFLRRLFEQKAPLRNFYTREELTDMVISGGLTVVKEIVEDYTNWVRTDSEETAEGVKTLYTNGILHFMIHDGYLVIIAVKEPRHIIAL